MSARFRVLVALWVASLVAVGALARAQVQPIPLPSPVVLSGNDIGFRVTGAVGSTPVGTLVVRVNGQWVVPRLAGGAAQLAP
jgi:hypothetical protein